MRVRLLHRWIAHRGDVVNGRRYLSCNTTGYVAISDTGGANYEFTRTYWCDQRHHRRSSRGAIDRTGSADRVRTVCISGARVDGAACCCALSIGINGLLSRRSGDHNIGTHNDSSSRRVGHARSGRRVDDSDRTHGRRESPRLGDVLNTEGKSNDPEWTHARRQAESLPVACRLAGGVDQFAIVLPNGQVVPFDDAANVTITKRISGAVQKPTIIRVHIAGKLNSGKISVDTIRM